MAVKVFVIAGQSNAVGSSADYSALPEDVKDAYNGDFSVPNAKIWSEASISHQFPDPNFYDLSYRTDGTTPNSPENPEFYGVSMTQSFASKILEHSDPDDEIYIIKTAWGGSTLHRQWQPGTEDFVSRYDQAMDIIGNALGHLEANDIDYNMEGFIFIHGEADTVAPSKSTAYEANLEKLVDNVRNDLGEAELPIYLSELSDSQKKSQGGYYEDERVSDIQNAQRSVAENDANVHSLNTNDHEVTDGAHYNGEGYLQIGYELAALHLESTGEYDDAITADASDNVISTGLGDDYVHGREGNDWIDSGFGNDTVYGHFDADTIYAGAGDDMVDAGRADDSVEAGYGNDTVYGRQGNDYLDGQQGDDFIRGDAGYDTIFGGRGDDYINGDNNSDYIDGGADDDRLLGDQGNDTLFGGDGNDFLIGGENHDVLHGGSGLDVLNGGEGCDFFVYTAASDAGLIADAAHDVIQNFSQTEQDKFDFSNMAEGTFTFLDGANGEVNFTGAGNEIAFRANPNFTRIFVDVDGDRVTDMQINMIGSGAITLTEDDFVL